VTPHGLRTRVNGGRACRAARTPSGARSPRPRVRGSGVSVLTPAAPVGGCGTPLICCCDGLIWAAGGHHHRLLRTRWCTPVWCLSMHTAITFVSYADRTKGRGRHASDRHRTQCRGRRGGIHDRRSQCRTPVPRQCRRGAPGLHASSSRSWIIRRSCGGSCTPPPRPGSINVPLRTITQNRAHVPPNDAAMKLIYLGLRNISSTRRGRVRHRNTQLDSRSQYPSRPLPRTAPPMIE
jgi:hypothetical protein